MSYLMQSKLAADTNIADRVAACAATLGVESPQDWAQQNRWALSARPGWVEAYAGPPGGGSAQPGDAGISDQMILESVQKITGGAN